MKKFAQDKIANDICTYVDNMKALACNSTDIRVKFQANKYLIDQCLGSPSDTKEESKPSGEDGGEKDTNELKNELDNIKNIKVIK